MKKVILVATLFLVAACVRQPAPIANPAAPAMAASVMGARVIFEVDATSGLRERLEGVANDIRKSMRGHRIDYSISSTPEDGISICVLNIAQRVEAQTAIEGVIGNFKDDGTGVPSYQLVRGDRNCFAIAANANFRKEFEDRAISNKMWVAERRATFVGRPSVSTRRLAGDRFQLDIPGLLDPDQIRRAFATSIELNFRLVNDNVSVDDISERRVPGNTEILEQQPRPDRSLPPLAVYRDSVLPGAAVDHAWVVMDKDTETPAVMVYLEDRYVDVFAAFTKKNIGRRLAIVADGKVLSAAFIWGPITGGALQITSDFTEEQASDFVALLYTGSLPPRFHIVDLRVTDLSKP